jgi:hypothetical protein
MVPDTRRMMRDPPGGDTSERVLVDHLLMDVAGFRSLWMSLPLVTLSCSAVKTSPCLTYVAATAAFSIKDERGSTCAPDAVDANDSVGASFACTCVRSCVLLAAF